MAAKIIRMC